MQSFPGKSPAHYGLEDIISAFSLFLYHTVQSCCYSSTTVTDTPRQNATLSDIGNGQCDPGSLLTNTHSTQPRAIVLIF